MHTVWNSSPSSAWSVMYSLAARHIQWERNRLASRRISQRWSERVCYNSIVACSQGSLTLLRNLTWLFVCVSCACEWNDETVQITGIVWQQSEGGEESYILRQRRIGGIYVTYAHLKVRGLQVFHKLVPVIYLNTYVQLWKAIFLRTFRQIQTAI